MNRRIGKLFLVCAIRRDKNGREDSAYFGSQLWRKCAVRGAGRLPKSLLMAFIHKRLLVGPGGLGPHFYVFPPRASIGRNQE